MERAAADVLAGGPVADVLAGHEHDPGPSALALRLFGAVHRLVLEGRALVGGLLHLAAEADLPVRLHEIGASAGLNLRPDHVHVTADDGTSYGPADSPVQLPGGWTGSLPPVALPLHVVERHGTDVSPVDPTSAYGRLVVTSFVWPDQTERLERLRGALDLAARVPATLERAPADEAVRRLELVAGSWTVLWHSVVWQYLDARQRAVVLARLEELGSRSSDTSRLAHLSFEPRRRAPHAPHEFLVLLRTWPGPHRTRVLGSAPPHGLPVTWE